MRTKMTKNTVPDGFTLPLAMADAVPVLFFCASVTVVGVRFRSPLFMAGAALVFFAGTAKVLWKVIAAVKRKNIWWMFLQMRTLMPAGMAMILASVAANLKRIDAGSLWRAAASMPSLACFTAGLAGMALMAVFAFTLDSGDVKSNRIEQITNGIAQALIFLGIVLMD